MLLAGKIVWAGMAFTLLTAGILQQNLPQSAAGSDSNKEGVARFVIKNEIKKMQEALRDKGHYLGKVDGVFGLQTRDSIRAYQKAENLPVTGQVDTRTADGLGRFVTPIGHGWTRQERRWEYSRSSCDTLTSQPQWISTAMLRQLRSEKPIGQSCNESSEGK